MSDGADIFSQRLLAAFVHLSKPQQDAIQARMAEHGIGGGIKSGIARLVGIRTPSLLSDMLAGRVRGDRYRAKLSEVLGVSEAWLNGDDHDPPDWALAPTDAYQRFCRRLRRAWAAKRGLPPGEGGDPTDDDSNSNRLWLAWLNDEETRQHAQADDRELVAKALAIDDEDADWLAAGRYERVDFELVQRFGDWLGQPPLTHPEPVRAGHRVVSTALAHQEWVERVIEERIDRHALPADLFLLARQALAEKRMALHHKHQSTQPIDDCIELLWRQHLRREHGMRRPPVPPEFVAETGRPGWTEPRAIHNRSRLRRKARV